MAIASGNLGVIVHEKGTGRLLCEREREEGERRKKKKGRGREFFFVPGVSRANEATEIANTQLEHPAIEISVHVDGNLPPALVLGRAEFHRPEHDGERDEHRVVRDVPPDAYPLPEPVHDVALVLRVRRARRERAAVRREMAGRVEARCVLAVHRRVVVAHPDVHDAHAPLRDEHALVPVVLDGTMGDPDGQDGPPSEDLLDHGTQVGQIWEIGERRDPVPTHHGVQFGLGSPLGLGEGNHGEHPPVYRAGRGLGARTAVQGYKKKYPKHRAAE
jgi:hypothetical protein